jgi:hypothetical protein
MLFLCATTVYAQKSLEVRFLKKTTADWTQFVGIDSFEALYYIKNKTLYKKKKENVLSYSNLQFGEIDQVQIFNTLKIAVLHKAQNSVILLDNRLAELFELNFNMISPVRLVNNIALGSDTTFWVFNALTLELELFDYEINSTRLTTLPLGEQVLAIESDYNNVYALTPSYFFQFNYTGSLVQKIKHESFNGFSVLNNVLLFQKNNDLYYKFSNSDEFQVLEIPKNLIKQFFVMNQTLYIYDGEFLHHYQLIKH